MQDFEGETLEQTTPEIRIQELERLIEEKRATEVEARGRAAKMAARLKGMPREGGTSIDPHRTGKLWQGLALGLVKGTLQAANDIKRESAERELREAESKEEQARVDRRELEAELARKQRASE